MLRLLNLLQNSGYLVNPMRMAILSISQLGKPPYYEQGYYGVGLSELENYYL